MSLLPLKETMSLKKNAHNRPVVPKHPRYMALKTYFASGALILTICLLLSCGDEHDFNHLCTHNNEIDNPTWHLPIQTIVNDLCADCHASKVKSYEAMLQWVDNAKLERYVKDEHYISEKDKTVVLRWIELEVPETQEDLDYK